MKTTLKITVVLLLAVTVLFAGCEKKQTFINIASGGTSGTYYALGGGMAKIWNEKIPGMNATVQSTGASVANVNLLKEGKVDIIFVQNDIAYYAANGLEMFQNNSFTGLQGVAVLYSETCQLIALASSGIKSVADLKGKRVAVGAAGSGVEANARQIMEAAGITYKDISVQYLSFSEAANNLKDGNIDAAFLTAGFPTAAVSDVAASKDIVIINLDPDIIGKLTSLYPFYTRITIPAGTYPKQTADVQTVAVKAMLAATSNLPASTVENLLKVMYENQDALIAAHKQGNYITKATGLEGMPLPLHKGAEQFFNKK
ncbi:MAG TPA: TAXI family TRAP transporter solute-binding subunit [Spirochaetia bacterium]|nr:TAXI family TRAP transporter solute-binding subunit [Spirochaetales bacterium]HPD81402.1 TAXI family TRAP transporter solute-binding subunit [Spirochaetales bacterium]HQK34162.1 TAXI family TRAP transporter solute-binding subunit [Spirochaetales bacterium]HRS65642.1 TAXI family TRAP transporter solute-binding subunit [Spirochaetia bacterium]HRV27640.1 TAXI family TRAP transporter solute-binding subunit [Spirochaetia bacterium]